MGICYGVSSLASLLSHLILPYHTIREKCIQTMILSFGEVAVEVCVALLLLMIFGHEISFLFLFLCLYLFLRGFQKETSGGG